MLNCHVARAEADLVCSEQVALHFDIVDADNMPIKGMIARATSRSMGT